MTDWMMDLTKFLLARVAEDEAEARAEFPYGGDDREDYAQMEAEERLWKSQPHRQECAWRMGEFNGPCECGYPARVLAECDAKRRIVTRASNFSEDDGLAFVVAVDMLRMTAAVYADHPEYDPAWWM